MNEIETESAGKEHFPNTEEQDPSPSPRVDLDLASPEGPGTDGNKPLMRNRGHDVPYRDRDYSGGHLSNPSTPQWFTAAEIALACGTHKKKVHRTAQRDHWESRQHANRLEYRPPARIADIVLKSPSSTVPSFQPPAVRFSDLAHSLEARDLVLTREKAVLLLENNLHLGKEMALDLVVKHFHVERPLFSISVTSLRRWQIAYHASGLDGLVEQKRGRVGRKAFALDLGTDDLLRTAAGAIEYGIKGRTNIARAFRDLVANPTVEGVVADGQPSGRPTWLHGDRTSKSSVPPSVRRAVQELAPVATTKLIQVGPKAMKLDGAYTECSYDNIKCGDAFTADDMTCNVYVWVEWPNEQGFLLLRPQLLATMDLASQAWLNYRVIIRPKGQYNKDDVWGLIGDLFDSFGLFKTAILEGGIWQSDVVRGQKTGISDDERFGGLRSIGVKLIHTRTPRGKIIEGQFHTLQSAADNCRGYCGRMEMKDCPEAVKKQLYAVEKGHAHPREYFLHLDQYRAHIDGVFKALANERNDGKVLRGQSSWEKWNTEKPVLPRLPENAKWLYRSEYRIKEVTRNGFRITVGSGKNQLSYQYANPEALDVWRGRRCIAFWNDTNPDTDAVIYTITNGRPDQFICVAPRVAELPRLGASQEQSHAAAALKARHHNLAIAKSGNLADYLQRGTVSRQVVDCAAPAALSPNSELSVECSELNVRTSADSAIDDRLSAIPSVADRLSEARAAAEEKDRQASRSRARLNKVQLTPEDRAAAVSREDRPVIEPF
jgi:hypothetical protein